MAVSMDRTLSVNDVLANLNAAGFTLRRSDSGFTVTPESAITDDLDARIREYAGDLRTLRACPVIGCRQLLPSGIQSAHKCQEAA